ncbi:hypothetical protein CEN45_20680 [Fischerella thermalis CCMEE 5198]|jgi:hypothetical protein|uniref:hypothetical protein n=1 Tax=Fischerella thermalis TaxID=372787 RepID=UPI000C80AC4C|nr:hypothetical protein [Fischerella thermalis]PLZ88910.1 hypothetical protein CI594_20020 [Fischerella thermalis CCMEE 5196]PMB18427.1 hypothetical protein CEN45_20680 [Fischerella thermalis CCMEE 5198]PMB53509.1 hypothetical protein CEN39_04050 [Fischerella thermalis CCMEE 5201]
MNIETFNQFPWTPLVLHWLAYAFLGWYLSVHHIVWLVGVLVVALVLTLVGRSISWLNRLLNYGSQVLIVVLALGSSVILVAFLPIFFTFIITPLATTVLAEIELRFAGFSKRDALFLLTLLAGLGLVVGETVDLIFLPSNRY